MNKLVALFSAIALVSSLGALADGSKKPAKPAKPDKPAPAPKVKKPRNKPQG